MGATAAPGPGQGVNETWLWLLLAAFLAIRFGPMLSVPFLGDDYVFLERTRDARASQLWSLANQDFGWFRPWSRDVHFWTLQRLFGPNEFAFRAVSLLLWASALFLFQRLVRSLAGVRVAWLATLGVAALELWGAPLIWISGTQDLWMLVFVLAALWAHVRGRWWIALPVFALALLSKETAGGLPGIVLAHECLVRRERPLGAVRRGLPYVAVAVGWLFVHPTLLGRVTHADSARYGAEVHFGPFTVLRRTLQSVVNADFLGHRLDWDSVRVVRVAIALSLLVAAIAIAMRVPRATDAEPGRAAGRLAWFGGSWAVLAWLPLFQESIGWHAYYGGLGAMGAWLAIAARLERHPRVIATLLVTLCVLHLPAAATSGWDWGSEWYQTRAGNLLGLIRRQLVAMHPTLPAHSRLYFGNIPNNIGLVAGNSPAVRVWYRDSTLAAGFYSYYRPRAESAAHGPDLFFRFDSTRGLHEVIAGSEERPGATPREPGWAADHQALAMMFLTQGAPARAAVEFEKIALLPDHAEALGQAAISWEVAGFPEKSAPLLREFARQSGGTPAEVAAWAQRLRSTLPVR